MAVIVIQRRLKICAATTCDFYLFSCLFKIQNLVFYIILKLNYINFFYSVLKKKRFITEKNWERLESEMEPLTSTATRSLVVKA